MGVYCCKSEEGHETKEIDDYNQNTYGNTYNNDDIFKTRPPCKYGYQCPCECHKGGSCIFKIQSK